MGIFFDFGGIKGGGGLLDGLSGGTLGKNFSSPEVKTQPVQAPKVVQPSQPAGSGNIMSIIDSTAAKYGVPADWMRKSAKIESSFNPNEVSPTGAKGLYQFVGSTAKTYGLKDPFDPAQNADAAARLYLDNRNGLAKKIGRDPTGGEVYLAHQQGLAGASALLARPGDNVVDALTPAYNGNRARAERAVKVNGGSIDMTAGAFAGKWTGKFDGTGDGGSVQAANSDVSRWRNSASDGSAAATAGPTGPADPTETRTVLPDSFAMNSAPGLGLPAQAASGGGAMQQPKQIPVQMADIAPSLDQQLATLNEADPGRYIAMPVSQYELMQRQG